MSTSTIIDLPETFIPDVLANVSMLFTDLSDVITLIIGVLLAVTVITVLINALTGNK